MSIIWVILWICKVVGVVAHGYFARPFFSSSWMPFEESYLDGAVRKSGFGAYG